jgi:hypothetical protein
VATPDPAFAMKMCAGWNRWVVDEMGPYMGGDEPKMLPMALIAAGDQDGAMEEIRWAAERGQIDLRRRLPVSGAYLVAPANSTQMTMILAWQEGQATDGQPDPICNVAPVNIASAAIQRTLSTP